MFKGSFWVSLVAMVTHLVMCKFKSHLQAPSKKVMTGRVFVNCHHCATSNDLTQCSQQLLFTAVIVMQSSKRICSKSLHKINYLLGSAYAYQPCSQSYEILYGKFIIPSRCLCACVPVCLCAHMPMWPNHVPMSTHTYMYPPCAWGLLNVFYLTVFPLTERHTHQFSLGRGLLVWTINKRWQTINTAKISRLRLHPESSESYLYARHYTWLSWGKSKLYSRHDDTSWRLMYHDIMINNYPGNAPKLRLYTPSLFPRLWKSPPTPFPSPLHLPLV